MCGSLRTSHLFPLQYVSTSGKTITCKTREHMLNRESPVVMQVRLLGHKNTSNVKIIYTINILYNVNIIYTINILSKNIQTSKNKTVWSVGLLMSGFQHLTAGMMYKQTSLSMWFRVLFLAINLFV